MATYSSVSTFTHYSGSSSSSTAATIFQASASGVTYLYGVVAGTNASATLDGVQVIITPTAGSSTATGAIVYGVNLSANGASTADINCSGVGGAQISVSSAGTTGLLSSNVVAALAVATTTTGFLSFDKLLIPASYYVQLKNGSSGSISYRYSLTQEAVV